jgi:prolyl oligopeptidase
MDPLPSNPRQSSPVPPATKLVYPQAPKGDTIDDYHGTKVADPYRGLEEYSESTNAWIEAENKVTFAYLESIPERGAIKDRLTKLWNFERFTAPSKEGGRLLLQQEQRPPEPERPLHLREAQR